MMIEFSQSLLTPDFKEWILAGFSSHAIAMTGFDEKQDPVVFLANQNSRAVGAVVIEKFWGALHIRYLFVEEAYRGQGIATLLMNRAFAYGIAHNCPFAFVETMSFQALDFYKKIGFELEYTRPGYAHQTSFHYLRKTLNERVG